MTKGTFSMNRVGISSWRKIHGMNVGHRVSNALIFAGAVTWNGHTWISR